MFITGQLLKTLRVWRDEKQSNLASALGICQSTYSQLEYSSRIEGEKLATILSTLKLTWEEVEKFRDNLPPSIEVIRVVDDTY